MQCFNGLAWRIYLMPEPESTKSLNRKNCAEMVSDQEYIWIVSNIRYKWKANDITRLKAKVKDQNKKSHLMIELWVEYKY